jgi:Zn-dependent peptidase ImmA (M78 family)
VDRIADVLIFPKGFFFGDDIEEIPVDAVSFRALSSTSPRQAGRVLAHASLVRTFSDWIDERYATPKTDVPSFEELTASVRNIEPSPVDAATSLRAMWGLGARPIRDILALLESHGVRVFGLPDADREIDAFSFWIDQQAYVFLNTSKSAERLRFDLAHELGHLCMHRDIRTNRNRQYELDANTFASSLLIPTQGLLPQLVGHLSLADVMNLKRFWQVSATAMVRRLHQLGRITEWQYRSWMIDLSKSGFRTSEPEGIAREQSTLLRQVLTLAREDGWGVERIARELGIPRHDLGEALLGLTVTPVVGQFLNASGPEATPAPGRPHLRAVK